jgi:aspartate 1-decarboxylase
MLKAKIHRATVTEANLHYEGSVTIDDDLLQASGILPFERIDVWNVTNGERFSTYAIRGPAGEGGVCVNGAGARKVQAGDLVIIAAFVELEPAEAARHAPTVVFVDDLNRVRETTTTELPRTIR